MFPEEGLDYVGPEHEGHASLVLAPPLLLGVWVRPEQVAQEARVRDVRGPGDLADHVEAHELGGETAVHADDLIVDERGHGQRVEALGEHLPQLDVVPPLALVVEPVHPVYRGALMVAPQQEEVLGVLDLVRQQQADGLDVVLATVDVVSQEKVVRVGRELAVLEKTQQIVVLAVNVASVTPGLPQIFSGASNSNRTGWLMNMSRDCQHKAIISPSVRFTDLPGFAPRTSSSLSIIESTSNDFSSATLEACIQNPFKVKMMIRSR